ncbi:MAG: hypothetical protein AAF788_04005 [Pseudomonadota bacterium]
MGGLGDAFSFSGYSQALAVQSMMAPADLAMVETGILSALGLGALVLFVMVILRQSGRAASGFALVALVALGQAVLFGRVDFLTSGTVVLITALTASALVLFVHAVMFAGQDSKIALTISIALIAALLGLSMMTVLGRSVGPEMTLAVVASCVASVLMVMAGILGDPGGKGFVGFSMLLALLASLLMTNAASPFLDGFFPTVLPAILVASGVLLATVGAPFLAASLAVPALRAARRAEHDGFASGTALFADDDDTGLSQAGQGAFTHAASFDRGAQEQRQGGVSDHHIWRDQSQNRNDHHRDAFPIPRGQDSASFYDQMPQGFERDQRPSFDGHSEPVSSLWPQDHGSAALEAASDEYIWDALAQPEVRCGDDVLRACGAETAIELSPEGIRARLSPEALPAFDDEVLGGGDPRSGTFSVRLATPAANFLFTGRRQVDHDGILMRIDGAFGQVQLLDQSVPTATRFATSSAPQGRASAPHEDNAPPTPSLTPALQGAFRPVMRLSDQEAIGFDATPQIAVVTEDSARAIIDGAAQHLAALIADNPRQGPFAIIDASQIDVRPGVIASAIGKAVRAYDLPRGSFVVGYSVGRSAQDASAYVAQMRDIKRAGGGTGLILRGLPPQGLKLAADMVIISALDVPATKKGPKRAVLNKLSKRFGGAVLVTDIKDLLEAASLRGAGVMFGAGRAFRDQEAPQPQSIQEAETTPTNGLAQENHRQSTSRFPQSLRGQGLR